MKKLLTVSLVAMMAVTTARAEIASKAYVDQKDGDLTTLTTSVKTNLVGAINSLQTAVGENSVADQIAAAVAPKANSTDVASTYQIKSTADYAMGTEAGGWTAMTPAQQNALNSGIDSTKVGTYDSVASAVNDATTGLAQKAQSSYVGTIPAGASSTDVVSYIGEAVADAGGQTQQQVQNAIDSSIGGLDGSVTGDGNAVVTLSQADGVITGTKGNVLDKVGTATGSGNVITAISENADGQTIDVEKGITALQASDIVQTYDATSTGAMSGVAVAQAITAAGGQTAQQVSDAINTKVGTLDGVVSGSGNVVTAVTEADGIVTATMGNAILSTDTINENGTWALTATRTGDSAPYTYTYQWELIRRAGQQ